MNKTAIISLLWLLAAGVGAHGADSRHYDLDVKDFTRLNVCQGVNVDYRCCPADSAGHAYYEATPQMASMLLFTNNGKGELKIERDFTDTAAPLTGVPTVTVCSHFLTEVRNSGDSTVRVFSPAPAPQFKATVIGNGTIVVRDIHCTKFTGSLKTGHGQLLVTGSCDEAVLNNTGVGTIQADGLEAQTASCRFFGTGTTGVWAVKTLSVKGTLAGKLYYRGNPDIRRYAVGVKIMPLPKSE